MSKIIKHDLASYPKGWIIGKFTPSLIANEDVEISIKKYSAGDREPSHCHKIATEFTVIVSGTVKFNEDEFISGDIIEIPPGMYVEFTAITDVVTVVAKSPSSPGDKYKKIK